jgi:hypothetical protein
MKIVCFSKKTRIQQNPNPNGVVVDDYKDSRVVQDPQTGPNAPSHDTTQRPKDSVTAQGQFLDHQLF